MSANNVPLPVLFLLILIVGSLLFFSSIGLDGSSSGGRFG
jgi:hypothetical protein